MAVLFLGLIFEMPAVNVDVVLDLRFMFVNVNLIKPIFHLLQSGTFQNLNLISIGFNIIKNNIIFNKNFLVDYLDKFRN